jgi:mannobiose 2-epimerase
MGSTELNKFSNHMEDQLFGHILPFWCGPALDNENGGWMSWLSNELKPDRTQPKGLIVNSRILWAFSAAYRRKPEAIYRQMADRAYDFLMNQFWDQKHGGAFWRLDDKGRTIEDVKKVYGQAFCIYALTEYHQAFGPKEALDRAIQLFELVERHAHDPKNNGYFEVCSRDWSEILNAALSEKDLTEKKSMNSHLHVLEAYTNLYRTWKEPRVEQRLRELIQLFLEHILDSRTFHFHHFFDEQWNVRSDSYTFGHDIEGSWLLCEAGQVLGDDGLLDGLRAVALRIADEVMNEAVDKTGAISYEGRAGKVIDSGKECWPQAEAVIGFLNAHQISRESKYLEAALGAWNYIDQHLVDRVNGEWFWKINDDGRPDAKLPKVSEWKGPYHGSRMCLEVLHRVHLLSS